MPGGRPCEYDKKVQAKAEKYLTDCKDVVLDDGKVVKVNFPSVAGLAIYLKVARKTVREWAEKFPEFCTTYEEVLSEQEKRLLENGLNGAYNSTISKLVLANHGYHDKVDSDHTTLGEKIQVNVMDFTTYKPPAEE